MLQEKFKKVKSFFSRQKQTFQNSFFCAVITEWNKINANICNSVFVMLLRKSYENSLELNPFKCLILTVVKCLARIRLGLSLFADHKFRHNFQDYVNPSCSCGQDIQTLTHFLLQSSNYPCARQIIFKKVNKIDSATLKQNDQVTTKPLSFGNENLKAAQNKSILTFTGEFLQTTEGLIISLFN